MTAKQKFHVVAALAVSIGCMVGPAGAQDEAQEAGRLVLAPHRAIYDLSLGETRGKQSLEAVRGRILYDFSGSTCEGYTLNFRQVTQLDSGEGKTALSDLRTNNWEGAKGESFRFESQNFVNNNPSESAEGTAARSGEGTTVTLKRPASKTFDAKDVVFPSDQMRRIIVAARAGKALVELGVYDGSDDGQKIYNTLTVIGKAIPPGGDAPDDAAANQKLLEGLTRWPVTVSYFDRAKATSDQTPLYAISFEVYENGVARALKLDYNDFALVGTVSKLEMKTAKPCP